MIKEICEKISADLDKFYWFYSCEFTENNLVVFVNEMSYDIFNLIPIEVNGLKVKVWYSGYFLSEDNYGCQVYKDELEIN